MRPIRTFIAIELPGEVTGQMAKLIDRFAAIDAAVKWVEPTNAHLTLNFLGDVRAEEIHEVCAAAAKAAAAIPPFEALVKGVGAFPDLRRPRTIWAGVEHGADELIELQGALDKALRKVGYPGERRRYHPHITLGRVRGSQGIAELQAALGQYADYNFGVADVGEATVFSSELTREGSIYAALGAAPLTGA